MGVTHTGKYGKRLAECRKAKSLTRKDLTKAFNTSQTTIGKYEHDEMAPSIEAAKKPAKLLDTIVSYLLSENEQANLFKDPAMFKQFQDMATLPEKEKECLLILSPLTILSKPVKFG